MRKEIDVRIKALNATRLSSLADARCNFPLLTSHPRCGQLRTNARRGQTYDQVGLFSVGDELPSPADNRAAGAGTRNGKTREFQTTTNMFERLRLHRNLKGTWLHADNGNPMKGATFAVWLATLGMFLSHPRPLVKNDNPYIESFFKTVKYHASYPTRFDTIEAAREWLGGFIHWYNAVHRHSGIGHVTPEQRRTDQSSELFQLRNQTLLGAWKRHPERYPRKGPRLWKERRVVYLNLSGETRGLVINRAA